MSWVLAVLCLIVTVLLFWYEHGGSHSSVFVDRADLFDLLLLSTKEVQTAEERSLKETSNNEYTFELSSQLILSILISHFLSDTCTDHWNSINHMILSHHNLNI